MARDSRFDGRFFVAVKTTGIFCRPICPANLPKEENVEYYPSSAHALHAGFRPCLRCRPDAAPSSWAWKGTEASFQRAVGLIEQGALQQGTLAELAERLGITDRYLRQLFAQYLGIAPKQYAQMQQLLFAKQLLHQSQMSVADIAFASGFNSVRRFNDAFVKQLKLTPSQVRKKAPMSAENKITLPYRGKLDWQHMLDFYSLRQIEGVEKIEQGRYWRRLIIGGKPCCFSIEPLKSGELELSFELEESRQLRPLVNGVRRMFDLDTDMDVVEQHLNQVDSNLVQRSGIRIPGVWSTWEAGVRAILGQQVSVKAAVGQLNLLCELCQPVEKERVFPSPKQVLSADIEPLRMPTARKQTLRTFAEFMDQHSEQVPSEWLALKGIGPWTVNYGLMRGASEPDCFLDQDLIVKKAMPRYPKLNKQSAAPWGSYASLHCWNNGVE
ncbi:DNA-3-methyladenine glycosylase 2 family protein [Vibrio sp. SCSIO 43136]|nr:DNA-3-methyladenine glycosylase 2 family protein [Vibrio sp. SCSIO 43136]